MSEESEKQEGQKTVVAFIAGLLIGGLLVWVFSSPQDTVTPEVADGEAEVSENAGDDTSTDTSGNTTRTGEDSDTTPDVPTLPVGDGALSVADQEAGSVVNLNSAEFPTADGWVAVRTYSDGAIGRILGAARYSESQGLIPEAVELLQPTVSGNTYAVVFFTEDGAVDGNGNLTFDPAGDQQIDGILETFTAQ
ncbi:MAG: hypothetical protein DWQ49_12655 [Bacteroidetes bacterium]|nr:MAG: hypothetical protein DWQ49_12655 [Bacteroidota bacterium]